MGASQNISLSTFTGTQYHLKNGDEITVEDCFQYNISCNFIIDNNAKFTAEQGGQLIISDGCLDLGGELILDGQLIFK